jgi:NhaP-type Na+/H+ and K+/H+ antiporter
MAEETHVPSPTQTAPDAGPLASSNLTATVIMVLIAVMGGIANFWQKLQTGKVRIFNLAEFLGEIFISGVAGLLAYWLFKGMGLNEYLTAAGVGIVGHMGSRAIFIAENWLEQRAKK